MELYLSNVTLEITRRCNMACDHCLRGDAQNVDMTTEVVDRLLDAVHGHGIGSITFTGGEPTLNIPIIRYTIDQLKERRIGLSSFFVVTNGKIESIELVHALIDLYMYSDEKEMCGFVISNDQYHEGSDDPQIYPALKFFNPDGHGPSDERYVISEGRANENCIGGRSYTPETLELDVNDDYVSVNSTLHVSANGNVFPGCDASYERIDEETIGNILTEDLKVIIDRRVDALKLREAA
jgi:MoaA/NifB/PqqE/SkfB family radical SAM enzyme